MKKIKGPKKFRPRVFQDEEGIAAENEDEVEDSTEEEIISEGQ